MEEVMSDGRLKTGVHTRHSGQKQQEGTDTGKEECEEWCEQVQGMNKPAREVRPERARRFITST